MISKRVEQLQPSGIRQFFDLVLGMKEVISLGVGEPDFVTPWNIREAGIYALEKGYTSYTSNKGLYRLRLIISRFLKKRYGLEYNPDEEILITVGTSEGLDLIMRAILEPREKVLIPQPGYVSYAPVTILAGGKPIYLHTGPEGDFKLNPGIIENAYEQNTKAIILNYPNNPTGVSYNRKELEEIKKIVFKKNLLVISDEIYSELTYDFPHTPFATLKGAKERTIYLNGFSKAYAMTGWRIGYVCGPEKIISAMTKIHQYTIMCVSIISQMAACEALENGRIPVEEMKNEYRRRREFVVQRLNELRLNCLKPQGAFYVFPSIKATGMGSLEFANKLLNAEKVAVVPGTAFGSCGEGFIRISYAAGMENLKEAMNRIERFLKRQCNLK
ncbi:MAG: aminotransferase class I/II-fold pyridoxal phosphate-dependent enzyme [Candidatus Omnitrophica bacterium]|nr:aminotransferase class I/II-fold pyridoxal phosphate-dependent enzyme [Candidatus Omnitrophota bacterium]